MLRITDDNRRWWVLAGSSTGLFVLMLDSTVVALALAPIRVDLGASTAGLQWVQNVYLLTIAAFVITFGRAGDVYGRRRVFQLGMAAFALGSLVSATAGSIDQLVVGRTVQGLGAAALLAQSLALVTSVFEPSDRARALGIWAAVSSLALALGPLLGGAVVEFASWRWLFWINLPLVAVGIAIVAAATPESRDETAPRRFDVVGLIAVAVGLTGVVLALVQMKQWSSLAVLCALGGGLLALAIFWVVEHRVENPIVDFSLFRNGPYFGASAAAFTLVGCYWAVMFFVPQYLQLVLGYSTFESGLLVLPVTAPMLVFSALAGRLIDRFGARALMTTGMACAAIGMLIVTRVDGASGYALLLPGLLLFGVALGLVYAPMSAAAMAAMPDSKAGIASGVLAMDRTLAGALILAAGGALFQHVELKQRPSLGFDAAFADALAATGWLLAAVLTVGALLTWRFVRSAPPPQPPPDEHRMHHRRFHF
jgi:EmrB/QacA subfamily drug resistance transporter